MKIGFISNFGKSKNLFDGQRIKGALYREILVREGFEVEAYDLEGKRYLILSIYRAIRRLLRSCDALLFMASSRGSCVLSRMIYRANRHLQKPVFFSTIGVGPIRQLLKNPNEIYQVYRNGYINRRFEPKLQRSLASHKAILLEQEICVSIYQRSFGFNNCFYVPNFRDDRTLPQLRLEPFGNRELRVVFFARIVKEKGPLDLLLAADELNREGVPIKVTFFGRFVDSRFEKDFLHAISESPNCEYAGKLLPSAALEKISEFDALCFPSLLPEGMPGTVIEALLAGTPIVTSEFPQWDKIVKDGETAFVYNPGDEPAVALKHALLRLWQHRDDLHNMRQKCREASVAFSYSFWRDKMISLFKKGVLE